jgi:glyoxylase I family protein
MGSIRRLVEVVLVVEDLERSLAFYRDLLGMTVFSPPEIPVAFLRIGEPSDGIPQQIVLIPRQMMGTSAPVASGRALHHIGVEVAPEYFERERERLAAAGQALRTGVHPFMPVDAFYLDDPDGNEVEIATWRG